MLAVGIVDQENVLYVGFKGTESKDDIMADINIKLKKKKTLPGGKFHSGFLERSDTVPIEYILECAENYECQTIVTCGHSLGGAVSSIMALNMMRNSDGQVQVYNITFGAPFFGNEAARKMCRDEKFEQNIVHYVDYQDIVPGLLSLEHTASILKKQRFQGTGKYENRN